MERFMDRWSLRFNVACLAFDVAMWINFRSPGWSLYFLTLALWMGVCLGASARRIGRRAMERDFVEVVATYAENEEEEE